MGRPLSKRIFAHDALMIHPYDDSARIITKQKGSRRYEVNGHGTDVFRLVTTTDLDPGQAWMEAKDSDNNVYFVEKLVRHKATLIRKELVGSSYQFVNGQAVNWNVNHAVQNVSVSIQNDL